MTNYLRALKRRLAQAFHSPADTLTAQTLLDACKAVAADPELTRELLATLLASFSAANSASVEFLANALGDELLVKLIRARSAANDSVMYAQHVFAEIDFLVRKHYSHRLGSVLEIGPGVSTSGSCSALWLAALSVQLGWILKESLSCALPSMKPCGAI